MMNFNSEKKIPCFALLIRTFALLGLEGFCVSFALWILAHETFLISFMTTNHIPVFYRNWQLGWFAIGIVIGLIVGLILLSIQKNLEKIYQLSLNVRVLLLLPFVFLLFHWKLWVGHEMTFLWMALFVGLASQSVFSGLLDSVGCQVFSFFEWISESLRSFKPTKNLPLCLVILGAVGYATFFAYFNILNHWNILTYAYDMGIEDNIVWNLSHGGPLFKSSPLGGPNAIHFGFHATIFSFFLVPFYLIYPHPETLLLIQALLIAATAIPLYLWAKIYLSEWPSALIGLSYLFYAPLHGSNLYDFHYLPLGAFFIISTLYFLEKEKDLPALIFALITLTIREDVAVGLSIIGAYLLLSGRRPRAGLLVALVGTTYFVMMKVVIMPKILGGPAFIFMYKDLLPEGEGGFLGVMKTVIGNPAFTLETLLERDKLYYILQLFVPLVFIPLIRPIGFLFCIPGFFFTLLSTKYLPLIQTSFQYTAHWSTYIFLAMVLNLHDLKKPKFLGDKNGPVRLYSCLMAFVLANLVCSSQFGAFFQRQNVRGAFAIYHFGSTPQDKAKHEALYALLPQLPPLAKVAASENVVPQLSQRPDAYTLRIGLFDADWILFSTVSWNVAQENPIVIEVLRNGSFGVVDIRSPFALLKKGYDSSRNKDLLSLMGVSQ